MKMSIFGIFFFLFSTTTITKIFTAKMTICHIQTKRTPC